MQATNSKAVVPRESRNVAVKQQDGMLVPEGKRVCQSCFCCVVTNFA